MDRDPAELIADATGKLAEQGDQRQGHPGQGWNHVAGSEEVQKRRGSGAELLERLNDPCHIPLLLHAQLVPPGPGNTGRPLQSPSLEHEADPRDLICDYLVQGVEHGVEHGVVRSPADLVSAVLS